VSIHVLPDRSEHEGGQQVHFLNLLDYVPSFEAFLIGALLMKRRRGNPDCIGYL